MLITRTSMISKKVRTKDIDVTTEQLNRWSRGIPIDKVCPHLSSEEREFILTGITEEEWDEVMREATGEDK
jgi:hypothetical protein